MNKETRLQNEIRLALSDYGITFRTNAGKFYQGKRVFSTEFNQPVLVNLRTVTGLPEGFSDTLFIGKDKVAFIEIKTPIGKIKPVQEQFLKTMKQYGHNSGVARSVDDAIKIIGG